MENASLHVALPRAHFSPAVLIDGKPVVVAAIDRLPHLKECYPIASAWSGSAEISLTARRLQPPAEWAAQNESVAFRKDEQAVLDLTTQDPMASAIAVAGELRELARHCELVTLVPSIDCAGLQKLLDLQPDPYILGRLSALDVATAIAMELGLGEDDFVFAAADPWARSLGTHPVARRVEAAARMIQSTIDAAAEFGLLSARTSIEVADSLPASKRRTAWKRPN